MVRVFMAHYYLPTDLQYLKTERGTNLLTSGWWGVSRHPNYVSKVSFLHSPGSGISADVTTHSLATGSWRGHGVCQQAGTRPSPTIT